MDILSMPQPESSSDIPSGPWVVTLENFLTDEECDRLIQLGAGEGYEISRDVGKKKFDGSYDGLANDRRTSTNAWCKDECFEDAVTQNVLRKIEEVTGVPDSNSEFLQLLRYEPGQCEYITDVAFLFCVRAYIRLCRPLNLITLYYRRHSLSNPP